jgi:hypothetical protein
VAEGARLAAYLLDPAAAPPARVSTADGLIAATAFFILQGILLLFFGKVDMQAITIAFGAAGLTVYGLMRLVYWRSKAAGVPTILRGADIALSLQRRHRGSHRQRRRHRLHEHHSAHTLWPEIAKAAAAAAVPRGWILAGRGRRAAVRRIHLPWLIFGGLRRSMNALPAMVMSAAIFAVVHPPLSMLPVFVLGLCAAWTYERSKTLLAPMLVHALQRRHSGLPALAITLISKSKPASQVTPTAVIFGYGALPQNSGTTAQMRSKRF